MHDYVAIISMNITENIENKKGEKQEERIDLTYLFSYSAFQTLQSLSVLLLVRLLWVSL